MTRVDRPDPGRAGHVGIGSVVQILIFVLSCPRNVCFLLLCSAQRTLLSSTSASMYYVLFPGSFNGYYDGAMTHVSRHTNSV
jgi:hypothetical protein